MATIYEQMKRAQKLSPSKVKIDLFKFIKSIEPKILEIEKNRLENQSKDIFGQAIGFYSYATEVLTKGRKRKGDPFSAKDTGDFFKGFYMQEVSGVLRFGSTDSKTNSILNGKTWLSNELFGLSEQELKNLIITDLLPFVQQNIREILNV